MIIKKDLQDLLQVEDSHLSTLEKRHSNLDQISMLSGEGSDLRAQINHTKGFIEAIEYVINEI